MKKLLFGIFLGLIFILSYKLDSFADGVTVFNVYGESGDDEHHTSTTISFNASSFDDVKFCVNAQSLDERHILNNVWCNRQVDVPIQITKHYWVRNGDIWTPQTSTVSSIASFSGVTVNNHRCYVYALNTTTTGFFYYNTSSSLPIYDNQNAAAEYVTSLSSDFETSYGVPVNSGDLPFGSSSASANIPTPVVNWVLNSDGTLSRTLQFTNAQLPQNPNIRMGLQLIVHWASVDNITMSYANQAANVLSTGYQVFYDNALSQDGSSMGYPLPSNSSSMVSCPNEINFLTNSDSIALFNNFLVSHPVSERTINYSPSTISSFADSFRTHLGQIDFAYNVPYVSARYYYTTSDGNGLIYGGWTNTYPKLPSQGAVLSINKQTGEIDVPINDGTVNEGLDTDGNVIFDNGVDIDIPDNVDFSKVNLSLQSIMSVLGEYPSFLAFLFPYLPEWIPQLLGISLGILFVVGLFRIILK